MGVHIGKAIRERLKAQGQSVTWFSKKINRSRPTCYDIFDNPAIDTELLETISRVLNYDFFKILSDNLSSPLSEK
ncbi:MAG: XRE family transcriptional regulator [Bacteroidales bacterium]|nr:XRE family transcriptional regulator [Bacteroidales bacterium]